MLVVLSTENITMIKLEFTDMLVMNTYVICYDITPKKIIQSYLFTSYEINLYIYKNT